MMLNIAQLAALPRGATALREHRKLNPSAYEKVVKHANGITRYYSDKPAQLIGEWVLASFTPVQSEWILIQNMSDDGQWYGLHVSTGKVIREVMMDSLEKLLDTLAFECANSEQIYSDNTILSLPHELQQKCSESPTFSKAEIPKSFHLTAPPNLKKTGLLVAACAITGLCIGLFALDRTPQLSPEQIRDPLALWVTQVTQTPTAEKTFMRVQALVNWTRLLPSDWKVTTSILNGNKLTAQLNPTGSSANRASLLAWLLAMETHTLDWDDDVKQISSTVPLSTALQIQPLSNYPEQLYERLRLLHAQELSLTSAGSDGVVEIWNISGKLPQSSLSTPNTIASLVKGKPVFVNELTSTHNQDASLDLAFTFSILGKTNEN